LSPFLSKLYNVELSVMLAISLAPLFNSWASTSIFSLAKNLDAKRRNLFELAAEFIGFVISVTLAVALGSVWAPVLGLLLTVLVRSGLTYALPHPPHRLIIDWSHFRAIVRFGKWITLSSAAFYAAIYIDRLFLGSAVDLAMLGIYGLARAISDLPTALAGRMGYMIVFPLVAANKEASADTVRAELAPARHRFILLVAVAIATVMAWSDSIVRILYDHRYSEAGWMLFMLLIGSWIGVLTSLNDAVVIGRSKPQTASLASWIRIAAMIAMLPAGFALLGLPGAIIALPVAELARYIVLLVVQRSLRLGFALQDAAASLSLFAILGGWLAFRWTLGLGMPWGLMAVR
jgi:O-antigen/teichoic acid export membrane protein